jgi:hypothetical protein
MADVASPVRCSQGQVSVHDDAGASATWQPMPLVQTDTRFTSAGTALVGRLIEPAPAGGPERPLVVLVHGSERTPALGTAMPYVLAAQGLAVFVYDKRGTGQSGGEYGQNFELLADDAAAAWRHARQLAAGRHGRAGYFGASQGGWVAPLAATRTAADFVAVAYGLVASPIDEDRDQMLQEAQAAGLDARAQSAIRRLSAATAVIVRSHFTRGFEALQQLRRELQGQPWTATLQGEYSGDMLRMSDADLRRIGRARFDNLELAWDHDALAVLRRLRAPLLWVLAGDDREAPPDGTRQALSTLKTADGRVTVFEFPATDHGMVEFTVEPDGRRRATRITDGYLQLLGDWMAGRLGDRYGRAVRLRPG